MRKLCVLAVFALLALSVAAPIWAADDGDSKWHVHGDVRARGDYFNNIFDYLDTSNGGTANDTFGIWPFMVRVSVDGELTDNVRGFVELRNDETFGGAPSVPFLIGDDPRVNTNSFNAEADVQLYQAYVELNKIGDSNFSLRIGRQEHTLGTELLMGDNDFYTGQTFDGVRGMWNADKWNLNLFYYKVLETNINPTFFGFAAFERSSDINFFGATFDWKFDPKWGGVDVYFLRYQDLGGSGAAPAAGAGIDTYGARWGKMVGHEDKDMFDWNIEYATQSGDTGFAPTTNVSGDVVEGWFGFNFHAGAHHRIHIGYLQASGDDPTTGDNEAFFSLFGDNHAMNRLGNLDNVGLSNIQDLNVGYDVWFGKNMNQWFMAAYHQQKLDQPVAGEDDLGSVWDVGYGYMMTKNLSFEAGISQGQPGNLQDLAAGGSADSAARYYGQVHLRW